MVDVPPLRIVFFGTPGFAAPSLGALVASRHAVVGVVTQPDRVRGRGLTAQPEVVKRMAVQYGLPVLQPERLRDTAFLEALRSLQADLGVVAAYGKILTDEVLHAPRLGLINVHASLLPKYRGAAPIHRAVMAGETMTGVTIMRVVRALDAGAVMAVATHPVGEHDTSTDVETALADLGARVLLPVVDALGAGRAVETPQDESLATYASKIVRSDGIIDWTRPAREIHNQIRGLHPWPHAFTTLAGERIIVLRSEVDAARADTGVAGAVQPGGDDLKVQTGSGLLRILLLQREGRRPVTGREFLAGARLQPDTRFDSSSLLA